MTDPRTGTEIIRFTQGKVDVAEVKRSIEKNFQDTLSSGLVIAGKPDTVVKRIRKMLETLRPGIFGIWYHHGPMSFEDRKTCLRLLGQEVLPAMREIAKELDLPGPFEVKPGSRPLPASGKRNSVVGDLKAA
jgi:hypothetical protein